MVSVNTKTVFFISDQTGITVETLGDNLLSQFESIAFNKIHLPFINTLDKVNVVVEEVNTASLKEGEPVLVFSTQIHGEFRGLISKSNCVFFDFFNTFVTKMEHSLRLKSSYAMGRLHRIKYDSNYSNRISSINFVLNSDDGLGENNYERADIILVGVSRSGKTPSCIFMALQYSIKAANYPFIEQDLESIRLPSVLQKYKYKLFGLTINPIRLQQIRTKRKCNSNYASLQQCKSEIKCAEEMYYLHNIPFIDTTLISIEEISAKIINQLSLR